MKITFKFLIIMAAGSFLMNTPAQIQKKAQVGFRFLENPVSAEVMGKGGTGVATTLTSNGIFWNPALIGFVEPSVDVGYNYTKGIADINYNAISASVHLWDFGTLGFSLLSMDYGTFYQTVRASNSQGYIETGTFSPTAVAFGTAFSQKVSNRFSYGVQVKYVHQNLGEAWIASGGDSLGNADLEKKKYEQGVIAFDVGAYYDFLYKGIRFGVALQNISRELKYENEEFPLPFAVSFGLTIEPLKFIDDTDNSQNLILSFESRHPRDFEERVKFGAEYIFMSKFIARAGYMMNFDERDFTAGIGVRQEISGIPVRVDYAFEPFGIFGNKHFISIGISYK